MVIQTIRMLPNRKKVLPFLIQRAGEARRVYNDTITRLMASPNVPEKKAIMMSAQLPYFIPDSYKHVLMLQVAEAYDNYVIGKQDTMKRKEYSKFYLPAGTTIDGKRVKIPEVGWVRLAGGVYHREGRAVSYAVIYKDYKWFLEVMEEKDEELTRIRALQHWERKPDEECSEPTGTCVRVYPGESRIFETVRPAGL